MQEKYHNLCITVTDREQDYRKVGEILHQFAENIQLRVGYPVPEENIAIIFLILKMSNDKLGALTGKLGQLKTVLVRATTIKTEKKQ
ncbi:MAG: iron-only hydrogenase system regulator [Candidatus Cloacimonadales bacterium]